MTITYLVEFNTKEDFNRAFEEFICVASLDTEMYVSVAGLASLKSILGIDVKVHEQDDTCEVFGFEGIIVDTNSPHTEDYSFISYEFEGILYILRWCTPKPLKRRVLQKTYEVCECYDFK